MDVLKRDDECSFLGYWCKLPELYKTELTNGLSILHLAVKYGERKTLLKFSKWQNWLRYVRYCHGWKFNDRTCIQVSSYQYLLRISGVVVHVNPSLLWLTLDKESSRNPWHSPGLWSLGVAKCGDPTCLTCHMIVLNVFIFTFRFSENTWPFTAVCCNWYWTEERWLWQNHCIVLGNKRGSMWSYEDSPGARSLWGATQCVRWQCCVYCRAL